MRKFLAIVLTIVMVASMLCTSALAVGEPTFRGADIKAKAGDTITYEVFIENNPGIAGYKVQVDFSDEAFDLGTQKPDSHENTLKIELGDFSEDAGSVGNVVSNTTAYGCVALWYNIEEVDADGTVFTVTLKVAKDAINGKHAVKIRCDAINTIDVEGNPVAFETIDGSVTVTGGKDGTINNEEVGPSVEELKQMEEGTLSLNGTPIEKNPSGGNNTTGNVTTDENGNPIAPSDQLNVDGENAGEIGSTDDGAGNDDGESMNVMQLVIIVAAIIVVIAVIALIVVKAKSKKSTATGFGANDDREMEIEEVMGWQDADDDDDED